MDIFSDLKMITYYKNIIIYYINTIWNKFNDDIKYIEKKVIKHINSNLNDSSSSDESDEEQIKKKKLSS